MTDILGYLVTIITGLLGGGLLGFIFLRKKNKAETLSIELDNATKVINIWKGLSEEQSERIKDNEEKLDKLYRELKALELKYAEQCENCKYKKMALNV